MKTIRLLVKSTLVAVASIATTACYQSQTDKEGKRLFIVNTVTGKATVLDGEEQFVPVVRPPRPEKQETQEEDSAIERGSGPIPSSRLSWSVETMWANNAARAKLTISDSEHQPASFVSAFHEFATTFTVGCENKAGFTVSSSQGLASNSFTQLVNEKGQVYAFEREMVLPFNYEAFKRVVSCTITWSK